MSFLSPLFLWAIPLVAVPVLIHLFARRKRELLCWGAMEFLLASAIPRRRFLRLRDLLLMLLRASIVLAMVCALSRPMLSSTRFGATGPRDVILIVDNSMSTARKLSGGTVFDRELDEARRLLERLDASDMVRVLLTSPKPEWLNDEPRPADGSQVRSLISQLRGLTPSEGGADMIESFQEAIKAEPAGKDMARFVTLITDGQARSWRADASSAWAAIQTLAKKSSSPVNTSVVLSGEMSRQARNLAVEKVSAARAVVGVGQPVVLTAAVRNTGSVPTEAASLSWSVGSQALGVGTVPALLPGAGTTVRLGQPFALPGVTEITCRLNGDDDLPPDNSARCLLDVTKAVPILIVEGEPQTDPLRSDTQFLLTALGFNAKVASAVPPSAFQPKVTDYRKLQNEELSAFQCVVLANVPRLSADQLQKLVRYVNSGGGLWIALGDQTDVTAFNESFFQQGAGLVPLSLRQPIGNASDHEKFISVVPPTAEHPATALLADLQRLDLDKVRIYRRHQFDSERGSSVTVLLRGEGGVPIAVEKNLGRGRVIVQAVPLGLAWTSFPLQQAYVVMVHEWLWYLVEPGLVKRNLQPGEVIQANQPVSESTGSASLEMPAGRRAQLVGQEEDDRLAFRSARTLVPGEYRLMIPGGKQGTRTESFLVSRDAEESNLALLTEPQTQALKKSAGLAFGADPLYQATNERVAATPKPMAEWLLFSLIAFLTVEGILAFWMTRQRRATGPAVVMEPSLRT